MRQPSIPCAVVAVLFLNACAGTAPAGTEIGGAPAGSPVPSAEPGRSGEATEGAIQLETATGTIHGTELVPAGRGPRAVALLVAGSGPTDRDGNSSILPGANNSLKLLAEALAARGIASVRYDKRGVGESTPATERESDLRFETYIEDAAEWVRRLRSDPRFSTVTVIGHSEGSLIGMSAARSAGADGFVSLAGIGRPAAEVLRDQLRPQLPEALWMESERILGELEAGRTADSVPQALAVLYRPSVQPYLISWFRHDPTAELARLDVPVLIVQGTTDIQVPVAEAETLHAASPGAELAIIEGMNHVLKSVPADLAAQQASYSDPTLPVDPELVDRIEALVRGLPASS